MFILTKCLGVTLFIEKKTWAGKFYPENLDFDWKADAAGGSGSYGRADEKMPPGLRPTCNPSRIAWDSAPIDVR
jgi:hypothetical protein